MFNNNNNSYSFYCEVYYVYCYKHNIMSIVYIYLCVIGLPCRADASRVHTILVRYRVF